jgi:hypothetical protein
MNEQAGSEQTRSEQICPVCGQHTLAVEELPQIDVLGYQPYSDIVGMGDLHAGGGTSIVCLNCSTRWRDRGAFDRGAPEPDPAPAIVTESEAGKVGGGTDGEGDGGNEAESEGDSE